MALRNGVLVHGPTTWACAVRLPDGSIKVAAERKRLIGNRVENPLLRGPARLLEAVAVLPALKRRLPEAKLPFEQPRIIGAMLASAVGVRVVRDTRLTPVAKELAAGLLALTPALLSLRGDDLAAYHGAEHISIGTYEHDEPRAREHERCGSHLIGPLLVTSAAANAVASAVPRQYRRPARAAASLGGLAAATELFGWMVRNPERPLASIAMRRRSRRRSRSRSPRLRSAPASHSKPSAPEPVLQLSHATELGRVSRVIPLAAD